MRTATFSTGGGPIVCEVTVAPRRDGAYELKLWEANENRVIERHFGNFINTDDDEHDLAPPNEAHDGRIVELVATVAVPPGVGPCTVSLIVRQDGAELEGDRGVVPPDTPGGLVNLFIGLVEGE